MAQQVKDSPAMQEARETQIWFLGWEDPLEEGTQPTPVFLPGESHGLRTLADHSPKGLKESATAKRQSMRAHAQAKKPHELIFLICEIKVIIYIL